MSDTPVLWPHQQAASDAAAEALARGGRGSVVLPCGTGKTLVAADVLRRTSGPAGGPVLFTAPYVRLLDQTLREWQSYLGPQALGTVVAVCSDRRLLDDHRQLFGDRVHVTTDSQQLADIHRKSTRITILATYHSLPVVARAHELGLPPAEFIAVDEAHRTTGAENKSWAIVHDDSRIPGVRRLYLTATPRIVEGTRTISMGDTAVFGPQYRLSFGEAKRLGLLAPYEAVVSVITDDDVHAATARPGAGLFLDTGPRAVSPTMLASQLALLRAARDRGLRKIITFHTRVADARWFATTLPDAAALLDGDPYPVRADWVQAKQTPAQWHAARSLLEDDGDGLAVVANARMLGEGLDIPAVDGVAFMTPRSSAIDIVQAVGRALRLGGRRNKVASILIPVHLAAGEDPQTALAASAFNEVWRVVAALASHDEDFAGRLRRHRHDMGAQQYTGSGQLPDWLSLSGVPVPPGFADAVTVRAVRSLTDSWEEFLGACSWYRDKHGDLNIPDHCVTPSGYPLGARIVRERRNQRAGVLRPERKKQLDALGMIWDVIQHRLDLLVTELEAFHAQHGHLLVPTGTLTGTRIKALRLKRRSDRLDSETVRRLDAIGMVWEMDDVWLQFLADLHTYKARFGHLNVPRPWMTDGEKPRHLGVQVSNLRQRFPGTAPPSVVAHLDRIGFIRNAKDDRYQHALAALRAFHTQNGHVRVPAGLQTPHPHQISLRTWLRNAQRKYRNGQLPENRVADLRSLSALPPAPDADRGQQ
ncbi:DEAD/DEAH box helicase [Streptomyces sp. NBC_01237]|uniref:DEAD/DEAH box helicase n=1 Tax=Streptomyces sp. NBC_01237 TaxID=2903790 RepID=UPI002DDBD8A4|nr:Helicase associated domain protein [Streptomyces sp. NBC_01237]WRZ77208.1 Helicase associated domain protein [Streptomyces sp. NBC_01237]